MSNSLEDQAAFALFFSNSCSYAANAFLAFDYILTFDDEVMLFWRGHQRSGATALFLLNRYITLASQIVNTVPIPSSVKTAKLSLRSLGKKTFAGILLLDGTIYFLALLILSVLQMTFTLTGVAENGTNSITSAIVLFEEPLTAILTSRFLIDLQKAQRKLAGSSQSISLGEVAFRPQTSTNMSRFVGSLGAQLSFHEDDEQNEGGDEP
ncbi:hypothetical protein DICSQDRAFT_174774 [Dichomitus squalens LYAD-421 SS1]|uniref:DUF6533 domain-containing protein n=1 Tax=Dichomitus squalens (strain LYAD-421) TaxID=732165 RepID=R7SLD7_DICSQ|nr:uncharacterized protein DICSQDRAFT_174774 [Dichomitus squalens LYAD-421 SS1]EJF56545.1 hypothetical protein DICSQDRAFT_174774 [Dichomitus squalens LYAD-421 SS1]